MISFPTVAYTLQRARIAVGAVAAFACLALSGVAAAAPTVYVHNGQIFVLPRYADEPMRAPATVDKNTCGTARINASKNTIKVEAKIRGWKISDRPKATISFVNGRATADRPVPLIALLSLHGEINGSTIGDQTRVLCVQHSRLAIRKVLSVPKRLVLRDMRIETWESWKRIHRDVYENAEPSDLKGYRRSLFRLFHLRGYRESDHVKELQRVCDDVHLRNVKFDRQGVDFAYPEDWACKDRGLTPG